MDGSSKCVFRVLIVKKSLKKSVDMFERIGISETIYESEV